MTILTSTKKLLMLLSCIIMFIHVVLYGSIKYQWFPPTVARIENSREGGGG